MISTLRRNPAGTHLGLMLALTFSTGVIDAVGYLGLDRVFTGNMTGNIVILGMALTGADDLPIAGPLLALAGFMIGAAVAGRLLRGLAAGWSTRTTVVFAIVAAVLLAAGITMVVVADPAEPLLLAVTTALGLAMGAQAGAARHIAVKDVTTVVVTSTITGIAADSVFGARVAKHPWRRRAGAIVLIGAGAAVGALALHVHIGLGMAISAVITVVVTVLGHLSRPAGRPGPAAAPALKHPLDVGERVTA